MKMRLVTLRVIRPLMATLLITVAGYSLGYSQSQSASQGSGLPLTLDEFKSQMDRPEIRGNVTRYIGEIRRRRIAFLPTKKLKEDYRNIVSDEILNELGKNVVFYLQISEFDCRKCAVGDKDGRAFAEFLLDRVKLLTQSEQLEGGSNPLFSRSIGGNLGPINGREKIDTTHVYFVVTGNLIKKKGGKERIEVWLSYINAGYEQPTLLETTGWDIAKPAARDEIAAKVAVWVAISLRPVIAKTT